MAQTLFDADALIEMFEHASARQGKQLEKAVGEATLAALQGRELTLKNIRGALKAVAAAASAGAAKNVLPGVDPGALLERAVAGMDGAMLKAVQANHVALGQLLAQGADLREKHVKKAMDDLDRFEDTMFAAMKKAAAGVEGPLAGAWDQVLQKMQAGGTVSGAQAAQTVEQLAEQMQGAMRGTRTASVRAAQALAESYGAMVSGVLIGMADALQRAAAAPPAPTPAPAAKKAARG
jgi:hypothetical protein